MDEMPSFDIHTPVFLIIVIKILFHRIVYLLDIFVMIPKYFLALLPNLTVENRTGIVVKKRVMVEMKSCRNK